MIENYNRNRSEGRLKRKDRRLRSIFGKTVKDHILTKLINQFNLISGRNGQENQAIFSIKYSPNYQYIIATSQSGHVTYYDPKDGSIIYRILGHSEAANGINFIDENQFFTHSDDKSIKLWDIRKNNESLLRLNGHTDWVKNVTLMNRTELISAGFDSKIIFWDLTQSTQENGAMSAEQKLLFTGTDTLDQPEGTDDRPFLLRVTHSKLNNCLFMSFLKPDCLVMLTNFSHQTFDEQFVHDAVNSFKTHGITNYPYRSLYTDDFQEQTAVLIHNWDSLLTNEKPIIYSMEPHSKSQCLLVRSSHGSAHMSREFTSVLDVSVEANKGYKSNYDEFPKYAKRPIPFAMEEPISRDDVIRECHFSDCQRFIASPYGVGCRLFAFDENYGTFENAFGFNNQKQLEDVLFVYNSSRLDEKIFTCFFSTHICQLACGTSRGTIQIYSPVCPNLPLISIQRKKNRK